MIGLEWSERNYEVGVDRGVFYPQNSPGVVWDGLISVEEAYDSEEQIRYLDGVKLQGLQTPSEFSGNIQAYTYPDAFEDLLARHQFRPSFGMSYRTQTADAYKIHLVYNVLVTPTVITHVQGEADAFSWSFTTLPMPVPGAKPSAHIIIEVAKAYAWTVEALENVLYGSESTIPSLPTPTEVFDLFEEHSILRVIDHGDGTFTVTGPDEAIVMLEPTIFQITWPSALYISSDTYEIHSL